MHITGAKSTLQEVVTKIFAVLFPPGVKIFPVGVRMHQEGCDGLYVFLFTNDLHSDDNMLGLTGLLSLSLTAQSRRFTKANRQDKTRFVNLVLPHLDAAFNLARWLLTSQADAEHLVQKAMMRAWRSLAQFDGDDARGWVLQIVRHSCYAQIEKNHPSHSMTPFDEGKRSRHASNLEKHLPREAGRQRLILEMESLAPRTREVLILKELEGCSYHEIAEITGIPIDSVASLLSLARKWLVRASEDAARSR